MKLNIILLLILLLIISCKKEEKEKEETAQTKADTLTLSSEQKNNYKVYEIDDKSNPEYGSVRVTFFGVSTLLFDDGETQLLIDGFFSRHSFEDVSNKKISTDKKAVDDIISKFKMNRVRAIFVSHSYYEHAFDAAYVAQKTNAELFGSPSTLNIGRGGGLKEEQLSLFVPGKVLKFGKFGVIVLKSQHSLMDKSTDDLGKEILTPLSQPAFAKEYVEGGSYDLIIRYNNKTIYIKPGANFIKGMLDHINADILFLGIDKTGSFEEEFRYRYYQQTVLTLRPELIIPLHWDNFFTPVSEGLKPLSGSFDKSADDFDWIIERTKADNIEFKILQWGKSIILIRGEKFFL